MNKCSHHDKVISHISRFESIKSVVVYKFVFPATLVDARVRANYVSVVMATRKLGTTQGGTIVGPNSCWANEVTLGTPNICQISSAEKHENPILGRI